ncbi:hypothetical protein H0A64_07205 [Alcaligenaceae bacterium]|nr:hypothetical protein [Alcaligenaceae bacterium]
MSENPDKPENKHDQVDLRLPLGTKVLVQEQALRDNRSMNAQIVHYVLTGLGGIDNVTLAHAVLEMRETIKALEKRLGSE